MVFFVNYFLFVASCSVISQPNIEDSTLEQQNLVVQQSVISTGPNDFTKSNYIDNSDCINIVSEGKVIFFIIRCHYFNMYLGSIKKSISLRFYHVYKQKSYAV